MSKLRISKAALANKPIIAELAFMVALSINIIITSSAEYSKDEATPAPQPTLEPTGTLIPIESTSEPIATLIPNIVSKPTTIPDIDENGKIIGYKDAIYFYQATPTPEPTKIR